MSKRSPSDRPSYWPSALAQIFARTVCSAMSAAIFAAAARLASGHDPDARQHEHARRRVEHGARHALGCDAALEVLRVAHAVALDLLAELAAERLEVAVRRPLQEQIRALGADHVIGRDRRRRRELRPLLRRGEVEDLVRAAVLEHDPPARPIQIAARHRERAAHDRRDLVPLAHRDDRARVERTPVLDHARDQRPRDADQLDVPLVARPRVVAEGEEAVLLEHEPLHRGFFSKTSAARLASAKPGITYGTQPTRSPNSARTRCAPSG